MKENSDKGFHGNMLALHVQLDKLGWMKERGTVADKLITMNYKKDGYKMHIIYGCEEDVDNILL